MSMLFELKKGMWDQSSYIQYVFFSHAAAFCSADWKVLGFIVAWQAFKGKWECVKLNYAQSYVCVCNSQEAVQQ